jgi:hypothetical protein
MAKEKWGQDKLTILSFRATPFLGKNLLFAKAKLGH